MRENYNSSHGSESEEMENLLSEKNIKKRENEV
jgi:hypothetical protein